MKEQMVQLNAALRPKKSSGFQIWETKVVKWWGNFKAFCLRLFLCLFLFFGEKTEIGKQGPREKCGFQPFS